MASLWDGLLGFIKSRILFESGAMFFRASNGDPPIFQTCVIAVTFLLHSMLAFFLVFAFIRKYVAVASSVSLLLIIGDFASLLSLRVCERFGTPSLRAPAKLHQRKKVTQRQFRSERYSRKATKLTNCPSPPHARI